MTITVKGRVIGPENPLTIAGPCAVESEEQLEATAQLLNTLQIPFLRGGTFKPRTHAQSFQGLGEKGLRILSTTAQRHKLVSVTEVLSESQLELAAPYVDMIQVGARSMFNYPLLRAIGRRRIPLLLKRGFGATIDEWVAAADYVAREGNQTIVLCERGIRTYTQSSRFTLDIAAIPLVKVRSPYPCIVDPSHAAGSQELVLPLSRAGLAAGADGVMIEVHPDPSQALSDGSQSLDFATFSAVMRHLAPLLVPTPQGVPGSLTALRAQIDSVDEALHRLLSCRFALVREIGQIKRQLSLPVEDRAREEAILDALKKRASFFDHSPAFISRLYALIFQEAKRRQKEG